MSYLLLIVEPAGQRAERTADEGRRVYQRMVDYAQTLQSQGVLLGVNSLRSEAARLELREGSRRVVDGPFTEAKEFVGGYFLLDCADRAQALKYASECPAVEWATIEVREVGPCYE
jgi:hypothetical protein